MELSRRALFKLIVAAPLLRLYNRPAFFIDLKDAEWAPGSLIDMADYTWGPPSFTVPYEVVIWDEKTNEVVDHYTVGEAHGQDPQTHDQEGPQDRESDQEEGEEGS